MLIGFTFKNFMSFYDENIFSMKTTSDKNLLDLNTVETEYGRLIKSALVFGANGSGKSNFIKAFCYMKNVILADFRVQSKMIANINNFRYFKASNEVPSSFELEIIVKGGLIYQYGFEVLKGEVVKEYLYKKTKRKTTVFTRTSPDFNDISLSTDMANIKELTKNTRRDNLFLYWANGGNNEIAMSICRWFESVQTFDADDIGYLLSATIDFLEKDKDGKGNVLNLFQRADINIIDFDYEIIEEDSQNRLWHEVLKKGYAEKILPMQAVSLDTKHRFYDENRDQLGLISTPIQYESAGTKKLFEIAGPIIKALKDGSVVFIDEIDSRLHPMLVRMLVMMFNSINENPNNAQLICNTHDVLLLEEEIRRDQIYFTEKDEYGVSRIYSLADFKGVRKNSKLLRLYLLGAFGATPKHQGSFMAKDVLGGRP